MTLTQSELQDMLSSQAKNTYLECLTVSHPQLDTIYLVNDMQALQRTAGTFQPFPIQVTPPTVDGQQTPVLAITADIVDQRLMRALQSVKGLVPQPVILYEQIIAEDPNAEPLMTAKFLFADMVTQGLETVTIHATFMAAGLNDAFPAAVFAPSNAAA